jgi:hypothetical protein
MSTCYFTVVTKSHLAFADTLHASFSKVENEASFIIFVVDEINEDLTTKLTERDRVNVLTPSEIRINNFRRMSIYYDAFELCNAVKASVMKHVLYEMGYDTGIYLDSDMLVFATLEPVVESLSEASFGLCPHFLSPLPKDGCSPNDLTFMNAGIYNGGFWIFKNTEYSSMILDWLIETSEEHAFNDFKNGMFVDQRILNMAVGVFNEVFHSVNDVGCNVAYWNLHERTISQGLHGFTVNGMPLRLFHFSGYRPESATLSKYSDRDSCDLQLNKSLSIICSMYTNSIESSDFSHLLSCPYSLDWVDNTFFNHNMRRLYFKNNFRKPSVWSLFLNLAARTMRYIANALEPRIR